MSSLASFTSSCQPIETAVNCGRSPTIISAAFTSSLASCPWVTTTTPITKTYRKAGPLFLSIRPSGARQIPVPHAHPGHAHVVERLAQPFADHHRTMPAAGAADRNRQIAFSLGDVEGNHVAQIRFQAVDEFAGGRVALHEIGDRLVAAGAPAQRAHEMRVRQAAHVE